MAGLAASRCVSEPDTDHPVEAVPIMKNNLALYSDQIIPENAKVDRRLLRLIGNDYPRIGFIPSSSDPQRFFFQQRQAYYATLGVSLDVYYELGDEYQPDKLSELLSCDAIHLSGGNTFIFLYWLRQRGMMEVLRQYAANGGVLIGTSAGAMLLTRAIATAGICNMDQNLPDLTDLSALGLVGFEFFPHANQFEQAEQELLEYSAERPGLTIYACRDGDGIIVDAGQVELIGDVIGMRNGEILTYR